MATEHEIDEDRALLAKIDGWLNILPPDEDATHRWLTTMYKAKNDRFIAENNKIWETGKIFVPTSLSAFVGYAVKNSISFNQTLVLAIVSVTLLALWYGIAETHRRFQREHETWLYAIERKKKIIVERPARSRIKSIEFWRKCLSWVVVVIWLIILLAKAKEIGLLNQ